MGKKGLKAIKKGDIAVAISPFRAQKEQILRGEDARI